MNELEKGYELLKSAYQEDELTWEILVNGDDEFDPEKLLNSMKDLRLTYNPTGLQVVSNQKQTQIENGIEALKELNRRLGR